MANQVAARLKGDDFQHLYAWFHALDLKMPRKQVVSVRVEDPDAASADDVTVRCDPVSLVADRFHQIKFHVNQGGSYSTDVLMDRGRGQSSLLEKLFRSWRHLRKDDPNRTVEIHLVSNWPWDSNDAIGSYISGDDYSLIDQFFTASGRTKVGQLRSKWMEHLNCGASEFAAFCHTLRLKVGFNCWADMAEATADRMDSLGLKSNETALLVAVGIVREWIKSGIEDIDAERLEDVIQNHDLRSAATSEPAVHVHLTTIKEQAFDIDPDYRVDWRDHFLGAANKRGHQLLNPQDWNALLLPELLDVESEINQQAARLVRVRGKARLSAWFAFGHTFSGPNGYTIEVEQNGHHWRSDAAANPEFTILSQTGDLLGEKFRDTEGKVAVAISVTAPIHDDVRRDVAEYRPEISHLLSLQPLCGPSPTCIGSDHDATALADQVKNALRSFCQIHRPTQLFLYYCGPISGACIIGHRLNAICGEIQIMEFDQVERDYHPSFLLR